MLGTVMDLVEAANPVARDQVLPALTGLMRANATYTALPHSNSVIAGLAELAQQQFGYDKIKSAGVTVALSAAAVAVFASHTSAQEASTDEGKRKIKTRTSPAYLSRISSIG